MAEAAAEVCHREEKCIAARRDAISRRRRGGHATADALAEVFVGPETTIETLAARYETIALSARYPRLRDVVVDSRVLLAEMHSDVLQKSFRVAEAAHVQQLIAVEDGAVVGALGRETSAFAATREALYEVIEVLAPRE